MHRLTSYLDMDDLEAPQLGDYWMVRGEFGGFAVRAAVAARIERELDRRFPPRWIHFTDLAGSRVRVRSAQVRCVVEATAAQRATDRQLDRAREKEEEADRRPWED